MVLGRGVSQGTVLGPLLWNLFTGTDGYNKRGRETGRSGKRVGRKGDLVDGRAGDGAGSRENGNCRNSLTQKVEISGAKGRGLCNAEISKSAD